MSNSQKDYSIQPQGKYLQDKADSPVRQGIYLFSLQKDKWLFQVLFETPGQQAERRNPLVPVFLYSVFSTHCHLIILQGQSQLQMLYKRVSQILLDHTFFFYCLLESRSNQQCPETPSEDWCCLPAGTLDILCIFTPAAVMQVDRAAITLALCTPRMPFFFPHEREREQQEDTAK